MRTDGLGVQLNALQGVTDKDVLYSPLVFQCPPLEEFVVEYAHSHGDYDTISDGQYSRKGGVQLRQCSFDTLFVDYALFAMTSVNIESITEQLVEVCESGSPFLLTVAHALPPTGFTKAALTTIQPELQMGATLRTLRVTEKAGEGDARYVNVSFTEYRDPVVTAAGKTARSGGKTFPSEVLIGKTGAGYDLTTRAVIASPTARVTLDRIARHYYGKPEMAKLVAVANGLENWGYTSPLTPDPITGRGGHPRFQESFRRYNRKSPSRIGIYLDTKLSVPSPKGVSSIREGDEPFELR